MALVIATVPVWGRVLYAANLPEAMNLSEEGVLTIQSGDVTDGLYDETQLRTIYLVFSQQDWWTQLTANYAAGVDIPADLTFEGVTYPGVGVRFRGFTSYSMIGNSQKKSFNITIDYTAPDLRLMGYSTLNLNNAHMDPSFIREALYFNVVRRYTPCPKVNFVKLVINGENWGVYSNSEQINSTLIKEWFLSADGDRWNAPVEVGGAVSDSTVINTGGQLPDTGDSTVVNTGGRQPNTGGGGFASGEKALMWLGADVAAYQAAYEIKSAKSADPWASLINTCNVLNNTSLDALPDSLDMVMNVDRWLWFLAVENIFADDDSYLTKGADYSFYFEPESGQLHPLEHDGNESFLKKSTSLNPFDGETNANRPVISRLMSVPEYRQRYIAHYRTILNDYFEWTTLEPKITAYLTLIEEEVKADTKKLYTDAEFDNSSSELENFITTRRSYLLQNTEL